MKIKEIISVLEQWAPLSLQESYDNSGLICGDREVELKGTLISLDVSEEVLDEAISKGCNLLISHHPIVFSGLKKLSGGTYVERCLLKAIKNDIALYAIHTNLDNVLPGVNQKIAEKLGLEQTRILQPKKGLLKKLVTFSPQASSETVRAALFAAGAGHIGQYDECSYNSEGFGTFRAGADTNPFVGEKGSRHQEPEQRIELIFPAHIQGKLVAALQAAHPYEEVAYDIYPLDNEWAETGSGLIGQLPEPMPVNLFLEHLKNSMMLSCIRHTAQHRDTVQKIALCGGSGSFLLQEAIRQQADVLVTADFKYHQFFDADRKILIADIGHYESEFFTGELIAELIKKKIPTFVPIFSSTHINPVNYYF